MIIWALLVWLTITGGYAGLCNPVLFLLNGALTSVLILAATLTLTERPAGWLDAGLLAMAAAAAVSGWAAHVWAVKAAIWLLFWSVYRLAGRWPAAHLHRAALFTLPFYLTIIPFLPENQNVMAFHLVALTLLALPATGLFFIYLLPPVIYLLVFWLESWGGLLALALGGSVYILRYFKATPTWSALWGAPAALAALLVPASFNWRLTFWADAWRGFVSAPALGIGPWQFWRLDRWSHGHNLPLTTAAEGGLLGLAALGVLGYALIKRWPGLPVYAQAVTGALLFWSIFDEPLMFLGSGCIFALSLGGQHDRT